MVNERCVCASYEALSDTDWSTVARSSGSLLPLENDGVIAL